MLHPVEPSPRPRPLGAYILGVLSLVGPGVGSVVMLYYIRDIAAWFKTQGDAGVFYYISGFAVLAGLALLPTYAQAVLGGYLFGVGLGVPAALAGFAGAAQISYEYARLARTDRINELIDAKPRWKAVRDAIIGPPDGSRSWWRTLGMVTLVRFPPNSPFALTSIVLASAKVPRTAYLLGTLIGMAPRTALAVVVGSGITTLTRDSLKEVPTWAIVGGILVTLAVVAFIGHLANKALDHFAKAGVPPEPRVDSLV